MEFAALRVAALRVAALRVAALRVAALMSMGTLAGNLLSLFPFSAPTLAATFGQTEVDQRKFIALAIPRRDRLYGLTILEQISNQRPCWKERGQNPTEIDPLLLQFNFTGICGRSSDSNGYSIRHNGTDLGVDYRLSLQERGNEVVLLGVPSRGQGAPFIVGRTRGISNTMMKIQLDPNWRFAKRNYQGKTLGHIYLSKVGDLPTDGSTKLASRPSPRKTVNRSQPLPVPESVGRSPSRQSKSDQRQNLAKAPDGKRYRLYVQTQNSAQETLVKQLVPGAFRSTYQGRSAMQVGLFDDESKARDLEARLRRNQLKTFLVSETGSVPVRKSVFSSAPIASGSVLNVPSGRIPLGNARGSGSVFGGGQSSAPPPPPNSSVAFAPRYKVLVPANSVSQQSRIRSLVQDSFRASYQGQSAMQVGSFTSQAEAESVIRLMRQNGFNPMVVKSL